MQKYSGLLDGDIIGSVFKAVKSFAKKTVKSRIAKFQQERKEAAKLKAEADKIRKDIRRRETLRKARVDEERRIRGPSKAERKERRQRVSQFATNVTSFYGVQTPQTQTRRKSSRVLQKELAKVRKEAIRNELKRQARKQAIQKLRSQKTRTIKPKQRDRQPPPFMKFA